MPLSAYTIGVPTKAYIKKYFNHIYGDPVPLNHASSFGDTLLTKLQVTPLSQVNRRVLNIAFRDFKEELKFQLPIDTFFRLEHQPTQQQVYAINRYLENTFETDLSLMVAIASFFGVEKKIAIERFCYTHGLSLEEEITYEALKQKDYRFRNSPTAKNMMLFQFDSPFAIFRRSA